jgi:hypothetical protein|tara:strand:- start:720 stop:1451 length:732 start_codon:yes stop_codon:yes gene_type:complete
MTKVVDMGRVSDGDTASAEDAGVAVKEKKFAIESVGNPEQPSKFEITDTKSGKVYTVSADALIGGDFSEVIRYTDDTIPQSDIKRYYHSALEKFNVSTPENLYYQDIYLDEDWVKDLWEQVNPGIDLIDSYVHIYKKKYDEINETAKVGNCYTVIVNLSPNFKPEDGGTLDLWTPNFTDEMKAVAINTPYGINGDPIINIIKSCWPRQGRVTVFDSRIPYTQRSVESDKENVSVVFKGKAFPN